MLFFYLKKVLTCKNIYAILIILNKKKEVTRYERARRTSSTEQKS